MTRIRTGWRLARQSWRLIRGDRSLLVFPALATLFGALALAITLTPGLIWSEAVDRDWIVLPFMAVGGYVTTFFVVYFNVALAGAARLSMDGRDTKLADGLSVSRARRGLIAKWALVQFVVGGVLAVAQHLAGESVGGRAVDVLAGLANVAWSIATFFVVPVLALEGVGPREAMRRSASLIRERWGEGLVGSAAIGMAVFLVAVIPLAMLFNATGVVMEANVAAGAVVGVIALLALAGTCALGSALGVIFRVHLYRYATEGHPASMFADGDVAAAFVPRKGGAGATA